MGPHAPRIDELVVNHGVLIEDVPFSDLDLADRTFELPDEASREVLEDSLQNDGQLEPIIVRRLSGSQRWQVVDGFRRVDAARKLGWKSIKARCFDVLSNEQAALFAVRNVTVNLPQPETLDALARRLLDIGAGSAASIVQSYLERLFQRGDVLVDDQQANAYDDDASAVDEEAGAEDLGDEASLDPTVDSAEYSTEEPGDEAGEEALAEGADAESDADSDEQTEEVTPDELAGRTLEQLSEISQELSLVQENWTEVSPAVREKLVEHLQYFADLLPFLQGN